VIFAVSCQKLFSGKDGVVFGTVVLQVGKGSGEGRFVMAVSCPTARVERRASRIGEFMGESVGERWGDTILILI